MSGWGKADSEREEPASAEAGLVVRVILVGSCVAAALAVNHFLFHSVLLTDALLRRVAL